MSPWSNTPHSARAVVLILGGDDIEDGVPGRETGGMWKRRGRRKRDTGGRETRRDQRTLKHTTSWMA